MGYSLTSAPPGTDPLPHRLEAHSMVFNYIDMLGVAAAAAGYGLRFGQGNASTFPSPGRC